MAGVPHRVEELTWREIAGIDLGNVFGDAWRLLRIPRLEEVLDLSGGRVGLNIHLKTAGPGGSLVQTVCRELEKRGLSGAAYIGGESDVLEAAIRYAPGVERSCMAGQNDPEKLVDNAIRYGCRRLQFFTNFSPEAAERAHAAGIRCNLFYADDYAEAVQAVRNGIDTVLTNRALALLNEPASIFRTPHR